MTDTEHWLTEFGARHDEISNPVFYWISLLALLLGTVGLLWSLPVPEEFARVSPALNWGTVFLMVSIVYYFIISIALAIGMVPFVLGVATIQMWLLKQPASPGFLASVLIGAGIGGLSFGHYAGGGISEVRRDVQLMMIAPMWALSNLYQRLGIPY